MPRILPVTGQVPLCVPHFRARFLSQTLVYEDDASIWPHAGFFTSLDHQVVQEAMGTAISASSAKDVCGFLEQ
jgi:hypothetical protein